MCIRDRCSIIPSTASVNEMEQYFKRGIEKILLNKTYKKELR